MSDYTEVALAAIPKVNRRKLHREDRHLPGTYSVQVASELSDPEKAAAALDVFHSKRGVKVLDDFEFYVFEAHSGQVLSSPDQHENGALTSQGQDLELQSSRCPRIYQVKVDAQGDAERFNLGSVLIAAINKVEARNRAHELLWDARLDSTGCRALYETTPIA